MTTGSFQSNLGRPQIDALVQMLKPQIQGFTVLNPSGERVGVVQDLEIGPDDQMQLVVQPLGRSTPSQAWIINSQDWKKIDTVDRVVEMRVSPTSRSNSSERAAGLQAIETSGSTGFASSEQERTTLRLLEERLKVSRSKRKVGEVILRKAVETRIVEVPVRCEKLIVEQVSPERKPIAEIVLSPGSVTGVDLLEPSADTFDSMAVASAFKAERSFESAQIACQALNLIAQMPEPQCQRIRAELEWKAGSSTDRTYHEFPDPQLAYQVLDAIVARCGDQCGSVQLTLELSSKEAQDRYNTWLGQLL